MLAFATVLAIHSKISEKECLNCIPNLVRVPFQSHVHHFYAELCTTITCQLIDLESFSNPLKMQEVL